MRWIVSIDLEGDHLDRPNVVIEIGLRRDQRGSITVLMAAVAPVLLMTVGLGIEVSHWTVVKLELQRTADLAALAGATEYAIASNAKNAANAAANLAELNGMAGSTARIWDTSTQRLTDNQVIVNVAPGVRNSTSTGVAVTVGQTVPLALTRIMSTLPSITIRATGWAEATVQAQPCILALAASGSGITSQGNPNVTLTSCSGRSNASISSGGSATMSAPSFSANGSITGTGISGTLYPNDGTIADPYANNAMVQSAFAQLRPGQGAAFSDTPQSSGTLSPGTYSSWNIKGTETLQAGTYYVNGGISLGAQASLSGKGVMIVTSGALSMAGGALLTISAATTAATNGPLPGVLFASTSTSPASLSGNTSPSLAGVVYYPNGDLTFGGTAQGGSTGCLEVIAKSVTLKGNSNMASNCSSYGALSFGDGNSFVTLVR